MFIQKLIKLSNIAGWTKVKTRSVSVIPYFPPLFEEAPTIVVLVAPWRKPSLCNPGHLRMPDLGPNPSFIASNGTFAFGPVGGRMEEGDTLESRARMELSQETAYVVDVTPEEMGEAKVLFRALDNSVSAQPDDSVQWSCVNVFLDLSRWASRQRGLSSTSKLPMLCVENAKRVYATQPRLPEGAQGRDAEVKALEERKHAIESQWWTVKPLSPILKTIENGEIPTIKEFGERVRPIGFSRSKEWLGNEIDYDDWASEFGLPLMPLTSVSWSNHMPLVVSAFSPDKPIGETPDWYIEACLTLGHATEEITKIDPARGAQYPAWGLWVKRVSWFCKRIEDADPLDASLETETAAFLSFHAPIFKILFDGTGSRAASSLLLGDAKDPAQIKAVSDAIKTIDDFLVKAHANLIVPLSHQ